jgi:hypothetical protein
MKNICLFTLIFFTVLSLQGQIVPNTNMTMPEIVKYRDSIMKGVMKQYNVPKEYGLHDGHLNAMDITYVQISFSYSEKEENSTAAGAYSSTTKSLNGGSKHATMLSMNNSLQVHSSTQALSGIKFDQSITGSGSYNFILKTFDGYAHCHKANVGSSDLKNLSFSFAYDKVSHLGACSAGGQVSTISEAKCDKDPLHDNYSGVASFGDIFAGMGNDPVKDGSYKGPSAPGENPITKTQDDPDATIEQKITPYAKGYKVYYSYSKQTHDTYAGYHSMQQTFTATIGEPDEQYEALIMPTDTSYEHWLPKGPNPVGNNDKQGDKTRKFKIIVRKKSDKSPYNGLFTVTWQLMDVTKYPGFCNNYPEYTDNPNTEPDLKFDDTLKTQEDFEQTITDNYAKTYPFKGQSTFVVINCLDYAAWGKLKAKVELENGQVIENASPYYDLGNFYLTIPYDKDENKLADAWEHKNGLLHSGKPLTWDDDDKPDKQKQNGDGYTLFEEYRGFAWDDPHENKIKHIRTNPQKKDCFIFDQDALFKKYYEDINPSGLVWHYVNAHQIIFYQNDKINDKHRWVNFNKVDQYTYARQYSVVLRKEDNRGNCNYGGNGNTIAGVTYGIDEYCACSGVKQQYQETDKESPLKHSIESVVYTRPLMALSKHYAPNDFNNMFEVQMGNTVRHEVGHSIGLPHHTNPDLLQRNDNNKDYRFTDNTCGVTDCLMRYQSACEDNTVDAYRVFTRYCHGNEQGQDCYEIPEKDANYVYVRDKNGEIVYNKKYSLSGVFNNNCYGMIDVKSKPGSR